MTYKSCCLQAAFLSAVLCWNVYGVAQEAAPAVPEASPAPAAQESAPAADPAPVASDYLAQEQAARAARPELFKDLQIAEKFVKRLPTFWSKLKVVKRQTRDAYAIQESYFTEIAQLKARIERLEKERDAKLRALLTDKQRGTYDELVKAAQAKLEAKRAQKEAEEEAETPE